MDNATLRELTLRHGTLVRDRLVPDEADRGWAWREFDGDAIDDPREVFDETATVPMFAGSAVTPSEVALAAGVGSPPPGVGLM